jgi:hypothetical protein
MTPQCIEDRDDLSGVSKAMARDGAPDSRQGY